MSTVGQVRPYALSRSL